MTVILKGQYWCIGRAVEKLNRIAQLIRIDLLMVRKRKVRFTKTTVVFGLAMGSICDDSL